MANDMLAAAQAAEDRALEFWANFLLLSVSIETCDFALAQAVRDRQQELAAALAQDHVLLLAEDEGRVVGMAGLFVLPFMFNANHVSAHEVVWWVEPEAQGKGAGKALLQAIEPACRDRGAELIYMVHLANSPP